MSKTCVHTTVTVDPEDYCIPDPALACGRHAVNGPHGFFCAGHLRQQQESVPEKPRKRSGPWKFSPWCPDDIVVRDIIETDKRAIANGKVTRIVFGALEPQVIRYWEA